MYIDKQIRCIYYVYMHPKIFEEACLLVNGKFNYKLALY